MEKVHTATKKHDRVLEIHSRLMSGEVIQKERLAAEYGVTERSIQRDIDSIRDFYSNRATNGEDFTEIRYDHAVKGFRIVDSHAAGHFVGCYPFIGPENVVYDEGAVAEYMIINNMVYGKSCGNLIRHWIISFDKDDYIMPQDAANLGNYLIHAIGENYISAFGVHLNTKCIHIHLIINRIGWRDGKRYDVSSERNWISSMIYSWYRKHAENSLNDDRYEKYLFGE